MGCSHQRVTGAENAALSSDAHTPSKPAILIRGAREHNLASIDVDIPRRSFVVFCGVSGSGKSSLVVDTIAAEAHRQYLDTMRTYARLALPAVSRPDVDSVTGLSPVVIVDQRPLARNPRSTVGTVSEAYSFLRVIFSRFGGAGLDARDFSFNTPDGACTTCHGLGDVLVPSVDRLVDASLSLANGALQHRAWRVGSRYWNIIKASGRFDMDKPVGQFTPPELECLLCADPIVLENDEPGYVQRFSFEGVVSRLKKRISDARGQTGRAYDGMFFADAPCFECHGSRLNARARKVWVKGRGLADLVLMEIGELARFIRKLDIPAATPAAQAILGILDDLEGLGLGYLTLSRSVATLSGGEAQRLKLARHLASALTEMVYIFDEPTMGMHSVDTARLVERIRRLVDRQNSVLVIEHDVAVMARADVIVELGPGGGLLGGRLIGQGSPVTYGDRDTPTGRSIALGVARQTRPRRVASGVLRVAHAMHHNLKDLCVDFPRQCLICITGVSGSGKSSLAHEFLRQHPEAKLVDQRPVGKNPRSNALTYMGVFDTVRQIFARHAEAPPSLFTFNGAGACAACKGLGVERLDMHFLGSFEQPCAECQGARYGPVALQYRYQGLNIAELLNLTVEASRSLFQSRTILNALDVLVCVGLGYIRLGQPLHTLSGGEAQRLKLSTSLQQTSEIYVLDEPSRGLHPEDVERLRQLLDGIVDKGNTVILIEHDLDLIQSADWVVDLGPGAGSEGGNVVAFGTPDDIAMCESSQTGRVLMSYLKRQT